MINRRSFLRGLATALIAVHIPVKIVQTLAGPEAAQDSIIAMLVREYNTIMKGRGFSHSPRYLIVGQDLMDAYEGELIVNSRFLDVDLVKQGYRSLKFKSITMVSDGPGWHYTSTNELPSSFSRA